MDYAARALEILSRMADDFIMEQVTTRLEDGTAHWVEDQWIDGVVGLFLTGADVQKDSPLVIVYLDSEDFETAW